MHRAQFGDGGGSLTQQGERLGTGTEKVGSKLLPGLKLSFKQLEE
ncbi:MAG: hypothetical protein ABIZ49_02185 [Opitutaceae bacterium]